MDVESLFKIATQIDTPLMLAGLVVLVLFVLYKSKIPSLDAKLLFVLALISIIIGGIAYIFVPKPHTQYLLEGRVFSPPANRTAGLPDAVVFLETPGEVPLVRRKLTDQNGAFSFEISPDSFGKSAQYWVTANGFADSTPVKTTLTASADPLEIGLTPATLGAQPGSTKGGQGTPSVATAEAEHTSQFPSCLEGNWPEQLVGRTDQSDTLQWNIHLNGNTLQLGRLDQFVHGNFTQSGAQWTGDLNWGNGDTWHNVTLTPSLDCRTIATNQFWYYKR